MKTIFITILIALSIQLSYSQEAEKDIIQTKDGILEITFINHASLLFNYNEKYVYVDPVANYFDYENAPKADYIFITHEHGDHFSLDIIHKIIKDETIVVMTKKCFENTEGQINAIQMKNGDVKSFGQIKLLAVPAYNIVHKRDNGEAFHPKGVGNGYVIYFDDYKVYVAGDTENIDEMKALKNVDIAFLPMNLPYTMSPEMVADAAKAFRPKVLYPYHYSKTDTQIIVDLLKEEEDIKVEIRKM